ncbi:cyclic nucleotide-binding/CBS domain-containing protein [Salinibaculum rarum]|uniref:CBS domain-containing protein n=1 Tax=Salinibaculum rarum TaxID=3058903 RepID=UPI00265E2E55|nr:CBS domain-containing protein [Salinibaculum sp. KK48]
MTIRDLVQTDVVTVYLDDSLLDVAEVLRTDGVGSAVVLDAHDEPLGIVTDRDLVVYGQQFVDTFEDTAVNEVLSMDVFSVEPDTELDGLAAQMREERVRRVPVIDDGELLGIITLDDIIVHLADTLDNPILEDLAAVIKAESPAENPETTSDTA